MTSSPSFVPSCLRVSELLDQHFDTAFAAPDGIAKLRELILTLAMQGKLLEQDPNDPPASELLKEIRLTRRHEGTKGKRGKDKELPPIKPEEVPYDLPQGWEWVRLGQTGHTQTGTTPKNGDHSSFGSDYPFIKPADITTNSVDYGNEGLSIAGVEKYGRLAPARSSLMVCIGTIGKTNIIDRPCSFNQQINSITPHPQVFPHYLQQFLRSAFFQNECWKQSSSTTIPILNKGKWESIPVAVPPLPEQHRIVARIDQLMARCDALEKLCKEREEKRLAVHVAALKQLLDAPEGSGRDFIQQHFGELYTVKENVAELRKTILQLAVMGRLVPQNPNDPPASELLKEIEAEKQRLVQAGKIKEPKPLPPIKPEEVPYELPQGWEWVRFFDPNTVKSELVSARDFPQENQIAPDSIKKDSGRLLFHRTVAEFGATGPNNRFYEGQILYSKIRPSLNKVVVAPYDGLCSADMYPIVCHVNTLFMLKVILSEPFLAQVRLAENRVKMPKLNLESLGQFVVPLPPLPEQHRIVARIDQLMALCDTLEQQIDAATGKQMELLNAVMAAV